MVRGKPIVWILIGSPLNMPHTIAHQPVMLDEAIVALNIIPQGIYIDATFGRGGHSAQILNRLDSQGRLICLDKDPEAIAVAKEQFGHDPRVTFFHVCFSELAHVAQSLDIANKVNGILLDLGVCSPQLEDATRGFSFMREGPLDMRMDPTRGQSVCEWINTATAKEIAFVIHQYGEEPFAKRIARKIEAVRDLQPITTTGQLAEIVASCIPAKAQKPGRHAATKTFQAFRIFINQELQAVDQILQDARNILSPGGRLAIISFHSLEDRRVKQFFSGQSKVKLPFGIAIPEKELVTPYSWVVKRQRPTEDEVLRNPRARSATLRVGQKSDL